MHPKFVSLLCCPQTGGDLRLKVAEARANGMVETGVLTTACGGHEYPIIRGVPRFAGREFYAQSFGYEWRKWPRVQFESENVGKPMAGHTRRMFETITGFSERELKGKLVVEFGCGPGRFLDIVRSDGGVAVGLDMSMAVESARENFEDDADVLIVQGDILNPPFKRAAFDVGYTIGVLHHTPDPAKGLKKLAEVVKGDGLIACCVYPKQGLYANSSVALYRKIHNATKSIWGNKLALGYSYFAAHVLYHGLSWLRKIPRLRRAVPYLEGRVFVSVNLPDARWRLLDVFDAITPAYASTHTPEEVVSWFGEANCHNVSQRPWVPTTYVAVKGRES
jgi:SAM-dependent methyltransferase